MENITISRGDQILAQHTTEHPRSSYGQPVWSVEVEEPEPGPASWSQGEQSQDIEIITVSGGWLVCRQPDGLLCGIIWSDGNYYANLVVDKRDHPARKWRKGLHVRGTINDWTGESPLGLILAV